MAERVMSGFRNATPIGRATRAALLGLTLACGYAQATAASAAKPGDKIPAQPDLAPADLEKVEALFQSLRLAFLAREGNAAAARALFTTRRADEVERLAEITGALEREFRTVEYAAFEIVELQPDDRLGETRHSIWVRLRCVCRDRGREAWREFPWNGAFVVEKRPDGSFALVDAPFFDTVGLRQGASLVADAVLAAIVVLALLGFWVWMGCEAFFLRPRRPLWRALAFVPLLGALVFFVWVYLPDLRRRPSAAAEPWGPGEAR